MRNNILLNNLKKINQTNSKEFLITFMELYLQNGFQSLSKKDIDLLLFFLMDRYTIFDGKDNYERAKQLKITPTKLKSLQLESHMRWNSKTSKEILNNLFDKILKKKNIESLLKEQTKLLSENKIPLLVENPVEKLEIERVLKENHSIVEYELNSEVIKVNLQTFVGLAIYAKEDKDKLLEYLNIFDDSEKLKSLLTQKDISKLKISDFRYILNELTYEGIKITATKIIEKIPLILTRMGK